MKRLSAKTERYPSGFYLKDIHQVDENPVGGGGFADVYKGSYNDKYVCLKAIRTYKDSTTEKIAKKIASEAMLWSQLSNPNVIPFYGLYRPSNQNSIKLALVSAWAENGTVIEFLEKNPSANRILLCLDTANGLEYLHKNDVVHGDLKGANILVDTSQRAYLADFGLSAVDDPEILHWGTQSAASSTGGTSRWRAPEHMLNENLHNTKASDIYAWGCVCYEIFTGKMPFYEHNNEAALIKMISSGTQPALPPDIDCETICLFDPLWELIKSCWARDIKRRPNISQVMARFIVATPEETRSDTRQPGVWNDGLGLNDSNRNTGNGLLTLEELNTLLSETSLESLKSLSSRLLEAFTEERECKRLLSPGDSESQTVLDTFQAILNVGMSEKKSWKNILLAAQKVAFQTGKYPTSFHVTEVRETGLGKQSKANSPFLLTDIREIGLKVIASGDHGDIYEGKLRGERVCLKRLRALQSDSLNALVLKAISREAILWGQLFHPNILPFYGIHRTRKDVSLVSPWAEKGNIVDFLKKNEIKNRILLCLDVARGLSYMHENDIIHGDIKGVNILVDDSHRAYLTDFAFSSLLRSPDVIDRLWTQGSEELNGGSIRWQAPELFESGDPTDFHEGKSEMVSGPWHTKATDVYAWSCLCYEVFTGRPPFFNIRDNMVLYKTIHRERPKVPAELVKMSLEWGFTDDVKKLVEDCWAHDARERPTIAEVVSRLEAMNLQDDRKVATFMDRPFLRNGRRCEEKPLTLEQLNSMLSP
ncbi:hypothetical protein H0H81_002972, partial [Sphagnurus paluster]